MNKNYLVTSFLSAMKLVGHRQPTFCCQWKKWF